MTEFVAHALEAAEQGLHRRLRHRVLKVTDIRWHRLQSVFRTRIEPFSSILTFVRRVETHLDATKNRNRKRTTSRRAGTSARDP